MSQINIFFISSIIYLFFIIAYVKLAVKEREDNFVRFILWTGAVLSLACLGITIYLIIFHSNFIGG